MGNFLRFISRTFKFLFDFLRAFFYSATATRTKRNNYIRFELTPFAQGSIRYAFKGKIIDGPNKGQQAVIKVFKQRATAQNYISAKAEMDVYGLANTYARYFNQKLQQANLAHYLSFPEPDLVQVAKIKNLFQKYKLFFKENDYICAEKYLHGRYIKWTNNVGYKNSQNPVQLELMQCFQHFTYIRSNKQGICCDLQGVYDFRSNRFMLTDPAVNSIDYSYGNTDCGPYGIQQILMRHRCNKICRAIGLPDNQISSTNTINVPDVIKPETKRRSHTSGI